MKKRKLKSIFSLNGRKAKIKFVNSECFSNGEKIYMTKTENEWKEASKNQIPACCEAINTSSGHNIKFYNWYAIIGPNNICSENFQIITDDELTLIKNKVLQYFERKDNIFKKLYKILNSRKFYMFEPTGYVTSNGVYVESDQTAIVWTKNEYNKKNSYSYHFDFEEKKIRYLPYTKNYGFALIEIEKLTK